MKKITIIDTKHIYFIGIAGISMSALAKLMLFLGKKVSGSDRVANDVTVSLQRLGAIVFKGESATHIPQDVDLVVFTDAISANNEEMLFCKEREIPLIERAVFLHQATEFFDKTIAVSGTHGKTTTTAMFGNILIPNYPATMHVGGEDCNYGNFFYNGKEFFITEACEYKHNLEKICPHTTVITNVEWDHVDCFESLSDVNKSFEKLLLNTSHNVVLFEDVNLDDIPTNKNIVRVGFSEENDVVGYNIRYRGGKTVFSVKQNGLYVGEYKLNSFGQHNVKNALCAIATCLALEVPHNHIYDGLAQFKGVKRRQEFLGEYRGIPVFADYAHHPTEIKNSIESFSKFGKIFCIFQPHTYSRTRAFLSEFSTCFNRVKKVVIFKTYSAREVYDVNGSELRLYEVIKKRKNKYLAHTQKELFEIMEKHLSDEKVMIILGAGNVYEIVKKWLKNKKSLD